MMIKRKRRKIYIFLRLVSFFFIYFATFAVVRLGVSLI